MAIAKKLTASAIASSLLLAIAGPAFAADQTTVNAVAQKMFDLGIIKGNATSNGTVDLNLNGTLTRAELITTIVRSFGQEQTALLATGAPSFADVHAGDWYSGWVSVAKSMAAQRGVAIGRDANTFDANGQVSKVEALVFVMKFMGINVTTTPGSNWYSSWVNEAVTRGIIPADMGAELLATGTAPAARGEAFTLLDKGYSFKDANGKSLYTTYADGIAPELTLNVPQNTGEAKLTLAGTVKDNKAVASVVINGQAVTLTNGAFAQDVNLIVGKNPIVVVVTDTAGNVLTKNYEVVRGNVDADHIDAADITVTAGQTADVTTKLIDKNGVAIDGAIIEGASTVGTFANGKFTAGQTAGEGTLVLKSGEITKTVTVKVAAGAVAKVVAAPVAPNKVSALKATDSFGNAITGVTFAVKGSDKAFVDAAGNFFASEAGTYTVVATKDGVSVEGTVGVYATDIAGYSVSAPESVVANGLHKYTATIKAVDAFGNVIPVADKTTVTIQTAFATDKTVEFTNGVASYDFTADASFVGEKVTIKAVTGANSGTAQVNVVAQAATAAKVDIDGDYLRTNTLADKRPVHVSVVDQTGEKMLDGEWTVALKTTGPVKLVNGAGTEVTSLTWNAFTADDLVLVANEEAVTGAITVTATAEGLTAGSDKATAAVAQGAKNLSIKAGDITTIVANANATATVTYTIGATDKYGVPVALTTPKSVRVTVDGFTADDVKAGHTLTVTGGTPVATTANQFDVTLADTTDLVLSTDKAGTFSVSVADLDTTNTLTATGKPTFSVTAGAAAKIATTKAVAAYNILRGETVSVSYQLQDTFGNKVATADQAITISLIDPGLTVEGKTSGSPFTVKTDANGVATVKVVAGAIAPNLTFKATFGAADPVTTTINARYSIAANAAVSVVNDDKDFTPYAAAKEAGDSIRLETTVTDKDGYVVTGLEGDLTVTSSGTVSTATPLADVIWKEVVGKPGTYRSEVITLEKAGTQTFTAAVGNIVADVKATSRSVSVRAGSFTSARIVEASAFNTTTNTATVAREANKAKLITVQLTDAFGNVVSGSKITTAVSLAFKQNVAATGKYVSFRDASGNELISSGIEIAANRSTASFFLLTDDTTTTFSVIIAGAGVASYTINIAAPTAN